MSGTSALAYERFESGGETEWMMRIGEPAAPPILILPPLFEEMNRTRAFTADLMRRLARRGFCCRLPDLPGTGESMRPLADCRWSDWREAAAAAGDAAAAAGKARPLLVSLRGGCLLDDAIEATFRWRFAAVDGASLTRDLVRAGLLSSTHYAGYEPAGDLMESLAAATPAALPGVRSVKLRSDRGEADLKLDGPALWRRSEPSSEPDFALAVANDLEAWAERCAAS